MNEKMLKEMNFSRPGEMNAAPVNWRIILDSAETITHLCTAGQNAVRIVTSVEMYENKIKHQVTGEIGKPKSLHL